MAFKLTESAQTRWRSVNAPHLVALVRPGAHFEKGVHANDPTRNQEVLSKSCDAPIHRSCLWVGRWPPRSVTWSERAVDSAAS
jgi:hypothetical protein